VPDPVIKSALDTRLGVLADPAPPLCPKGPSPKKNKERPLQWVGAPVSEAGCSVTVVRTEKTVPVSDVPRKGNNGIH